MQDTSSSPVAPVVAPAAAERDLAIVGHAEREQEVTEFVAEQLSVNRGLLNPATRLGHDLGLDGDDGAEFMQAFAQHFGVDLSQFRCDHHFGPESAFNPLAYLWLLLFDRKQLRLVPITIADLVEATQRGRWQTPDRAPI